MGEIKDGVRVKVVRPYGHDRYSHDLCMTRLGQVGTCGGVDPDMEDYPVLVRFDEPDADGDYAMCFGFDELEAVC